MTVKELVLQLIVMPWDAEVFFDTDAAQFNVHLVPIDSVMHEPELGLPEVILHSKAKRDYGESAQASILRCGAAFRAYGMLHSQHDRATPQSPRVVRDAGTDDAHELFEAGWRAALKLGDEK